MSVCGDCGCSLGAGECVAHHAGCARVDARPAPVLTHEMAACLRGEHQATLSNSQWIRVSIHKGAEGRCIVIVRGDVCARCRCVFVSPGPA